MKKYDDVKCTLATTHGCDHHDAVNRIEIRLKRQRHAISAFRSIAEHTTEGAPVCNAELSVAEAMIAELAVHDAANVVELFVQTFVVF